MARSIEYSTAPLPTKPDRFTRALQHADFLTHAPRSGLPTTDFKTRCVCVQYDCTCAGDLACRAPKCTHQTHSIPFRGSDLLSRPRRKCRESQLIGQTPPVWSRTDTDSRKLGSSPDPVVPCSLLVHVVKCVRLWSTMNITAVLRFSPHENQEKKCEAIQMLSTAPTYTTT